MLNVSTAESIITLVTFLIAYGVSVTIAGFFTAWICLKMGDDTPEQEGFLTLNPLAHIDFLGTIFLVLYKFGWGKFIAINPYNITGRFRLLKVFFAFSSKAIGHFLLAMASIITLLGIFGQRVLMGPLPQEFPNASSYIISIGYILLSMMITNTILAITSFLVYICGLLVMLYAEKHPQYLAYTSLVMFIVPVIIFYLCGRPIVLFIFGIIHAVSYSLALLLHLC